MLLILFFGLLFYRDDIPLKKRKIEFNIEADGELVIPSTEHRQRKKCAKLNDGLAIKYNKLMLNYEKIIRFTHFRRYCVFFDIFSKRHLINHCYRIDLLERLNRYDYRPYSYENCTCMASTTAISQNGKKCQLNYPKIGGFLICFRSEFMHRKKYSNHREEKSENMKYLYEKHSLLHEDNNFYDNRINECFRQKIKKFETISSLMGLNKKMMRILHKNMYTAPPYLPTCDRCKNLLNTKFPTWRAVRFLNCLDMNYLCDYVLKLDNMFLIPDYMENINHMDTSAIINNNNSNTISTTIKTNYNAMDDTTNNCSREATNIIIYKTTKSNIVFIHENIFYVINPTNVLLIFDLKTFRQTQFFCNFNFYFIKQCTTYNSNNYININNQ